MSIKIKKSKKGTFTKAAKARGKSVKEFENQVLTHRDNYSTAMRKKAQFSKNSKKWKKGENGLLIGDDPKIPTKDQNPYYGTEFPWDTKDLNPYYGTEMPEDDGGLTQRMPTDKIEKYRGQAPIGTQINPNFRGNQPNVPPKKKIDLSNTIAGTLVAFDAILPKQKINRKYVRPEDQLSYNQNPYGTNSQAIFEDGGLLPKKKRKKSQNVVDDAIYTNGMQYSGTTESDNPTEEDWLKNMVEYAKNNWWETSNVYRPQFQHLTTNVDVQDINPTVAKKGAKITLQSMGDGGKKKGPEPIVTNNPNDPRLRAYQDSLNLYNTVTKQLNKNKNVRPDWINTNTKVISNEEAFNKIKNSTERDYLSTENDRRKFLISPFNKDVEEYIYGENLRGYRNLSNDPSLNNQSLEEFRKMYSAKNQKYIDEIKKSKIQPLNFRDSDGIIPIRGGNGQQTVIKDGVMFPVYKKPVQPVVYQKEPQLKRVDATAPVNDVAVPQFTRPQVGAVSLMQPQGEFNYRVEYTDPFTNKETHKDFPNEKQGSQFQKGLQGNRTGYWLPKKRKGGKMLNVMSLENGGYIQSYAGGSAPKVSNNTFDGGMGMFVGNSHKEGGIKATFNGKPFEAEGGEPYRMTPDGSLEIFGNLENPITGNKFKKDAKMLAKKEQKASKLTDMGTELVNTTPPSKNKFEMLKFNSGQAMLRGGLGEQKKLAKEKENLSMMQRIMLQEESPEKAEHGGYYAEGGVVDPEKELKEQKEYYQNILKNPKKHYEWEVAQAKEFIKNPSSFYEGLIEYNNNQIKQGNKDSYLKDEINDYKEVLNYLKNPNKNKAKIKKVETPLQNSTNTQSTNLPKENTVSQELTPISPVGTPDPREKFETTRVKTLEQLKKLYPNKKIEIKYNELGKERSNKQQNAIKSRQSEKLSKDWSTHNWDAGRDYNIYIDGQLQKSGSKVYSTLHSIGKKEGLFNLKGKAGIEDPYHLSLVEEGGPNTAQKLLSAYPEVANFDATKNWLSEIEKFNGPLTENLNKAYNALPKNKISYSNQPVDAPDLSIPKGMQLIGENLFKMPIDKWTPGKKIHPQDKPTTDTAANYTPQPFNFTNPPARNKPVVKGRFPWEQAAPLVPALIDQPDAVQAQQFNPELYTPYQVSFQDRRNRNTTQLNSIAQRSGYDPSALGVYGAQAYQANNEIDAEEFRTNQGISNDITNKNIALLNDAELKNLGILDQQYARQTQAIANTRDRRLEAGIQLGDVIAKNNLENKTLNVMGELYKDYTFDENGQLKYIGPSAGEQINFSGFPTRQNTKSVETQKIGDKTIQNTYEPVYNFDNTKKKLRKQFKQGGKLTQKTLSKMVYC